MRVNLTSEQSVYFGQKFLDLIRNMPSLTKGKISLKETEGVFHSLSKSDQTNKFSRPLWDGVIKSNLPPTVSRVGVIGAELPSVAIIPDFKGGVDVIIEIDSTEEKLEIKTINLEKGGLAANTTEALFKMGYGARFFSIHGRGEIADFHERLLRDSGINPVRLIDSGRDAYIHPCTIEKNDRKQEFWFVQNREAFPEHVIKESTEILEAELKRGSNETLVLSAIPPAGASNDYFAIMSRIAHANNKPVVFNPKQYDHIEEITLKLFGEGRVDILKPNVVEFVQFLKYAGIVYENEKDKTNELKKEIKNHDFIQTIHLARKLMNQKGFMYRIRMMFITFGEDGLLIVTPRHVVHLEVPKIKLECSSGAGDSGIAGIIAQANENKIDLRSNLHSSTLEELGRAFIYAATATASLPGNNIAGRKEIEALKNQEKIKTITFSIF